MKEISLWEDVSLSTIGEIEEWTNNVELADLNGDGWVDILFANGGDYKSPSQPVFSIEKVNTSASGNPLQIRARIHDHKSPTMTHDWTSVVLKLMVDAQIQEIPMQ